MKIINGDFGSKLYTVLFKYTKLCGLMPIQLVNNVIPNVVKSTFWTIGYSIFSALIAINVLLFCGYKHIKAVFHRDKDHETVVIVIVIGMTVSTLKVVWFYVSQIVNHSKLIGLVNEGFQMKIYVMKVCDVKDVFLDKQCQYMTCTKLIAFLGQNLIFFYTCTLYETFNAGPYEMIYINCLLTIVLQGVSVLFGWVYFGGMIFLLQCYRYINNQLDIAIKLINNIDQNERRQMKMQKYCDVCDTIDEIANLYSQIAEYVRKCNSFNAFLLTLALLDGFLSGLYGVIRNGFKFILNFPLTRLLFFFFFSYST